MDGVEGKSIVISYAPQDREIALQLKKIFEQFFPNDLWLRDFDLNGGDLLASALDVAISEAKWFVLLLTENAKNSDWVRREANLATFKAIEDQDFRIAILQLCGPPVPRHLRLALKDRHVIDLSQASDLDDGFLKLLGLVDRTGPTRSEREVYVDRGADADRLTLALRRNQIVFVAGLAGIGKTSFVLRSAAEKLGKRPLVVRLTQGHSADLLARQILSRSYVRQPLSEERSDDELLNAAVDALRKRADKFFLFLDNAEDGLNLADNSLSPYLDEFLMGVIKAGIDTHVLVATSRRPNYSAGIGASADTLRLGGMDDIYVKESIELWLEGTEAQASLGRKAEMDLLVKLAGGHPLAAKMIASYLKVNRGPEQLLERRQRLRFELKLAEHIIRSGQHQLLELHKLILHTLAAVREPMTVQDMLAIEDMRTYPIDDIQEARWQLSDWFLVEQVGELMYLHKFIETFFREQLNSVEGRFERIASDYGKYACRRAFELEQGVQRKLQDGVSAEDASVIEWSNEVLRYAVPAAKLLRYVGEEDLARKLPIQVKGSLRQMVFYFYQEKRDYKQALRYADRWLELSPHDYEILLYKARCYRNFRDADSLRRAEEIVRHLEQRVSTSSFLARLLRERGLIEEQKGDLQAAKAFFQTGIGLGPTAGYPDNHVGLAQVLLREADGLPPDWEERKRLLWEAVSILEAAREDSATFDRYHLPTYVEALVEYGQDESALDLLTDALRERPGDPRLNYRMAEVLRKKGDFDQAEKYARRAISSGSMKARLTLANTLCGRAVDLINRDEREEADRQLGEALDALSGFHPEFGGDEEVASGTKAKVFRLLGDWGNAQAAVNRYEESSNPYTLYERCQIHLGKAEAEDAEGNPQEAIAELGRLIERVKGFESRKKVPKPVQELFETAKARESELKAKLADHGNL